MGNQLGFVLKLLLLSALLSVLIKYLGQKSINSGDRNQRANYSIVADCNYSDRATVAISSTETKLTQTIYAQVTKIS